MFIIEFDSVDCCDCQEVILIVFYTIFNGPLTDLKQILIC